MLPPLRIPALVRPGLLPSLVGWMACLAVLALGCGVVIRSCGNDPGPLAAYAGYLLLHVLLPGIVLLVAVRRRPIGLTETVALAVPTGLAVEILSYLSCAALGARGIFPWLPAGWVVLGLLQWREQGRGPLRWRVAGRHAGVMVSLLVLCLATTVMAASQMYAESPLEAGLPTRAIFHDWVYLVSRAGVIKHTWPLDDPSLSGTPLQYHYFMMVHAAAASSVAGLELSALMLRLIYVPLGAILVAQAFLLGRSVARSAWAGVGAAALLVLASEFSFSPSYGEPRFLGIFVRWLFVSPTFFFGMIFCGAILIAVGHALRHPRMALLEWLWLVLLGAAGTGAKGTVLPVIICALGLWTLWRWTREGRLPWRLVAFGGLLGLSFLIVYAPTMSAWRTGDAAWRPFHVCELSSFWKEHAGAWQQALAAWLPAGLAKWTARTACAVVVFAGTCGVRLLALAYLPRVDRARRNGVLVPWLGAFLAACAGMGLLMELNSYGELYLLLMVRLPMAVLTAACLVAFGRAAAAGARLGFGRARWPLLPRLAIGSGLLAVVAVLGVQVSLWAVRNHGGFREWFKTPVDLRADDDMRELSEALVWVRRHTEPNAVLVSNACTPENMRNDHWGALDRTLTGVHFYYSALSERRVWFEGPNYILDTTRARIRANLASNFFYRRGPLPPSWVGPGPAYILHDRSLDDCSIVRLPPAARMFSNARMDVYRLDGPWAPLVPAPGDGQD